PGFSTFPDIRYLFWGENPNTFGFVAHRSGSGGFLDVLVYRINRDKTSAASPVAGQTADGRPILQATRILRTALFPNLNLSTHSYDVQYHTHRSAHITIIRIADFLEGDRSWACQEAARETTRLEDVVHESKTRTVQINPGIGQLEGSSLEVTNPTERISSQLVSAWIDSNEKLHALYRIKYLVAIQTTIGVPFAQAFASHPIAPPLFTNRVGGISIDDPVNTPVPWPVPSLSVFLQNQTIFPLGLQAPTFDEWNDIVLLNLTDGTIASKTFDDVVRFSWEEDFHIYVTSPVIHVWGWSKGPAQLEPTDQWNFTPYDVTAAPIGTATFPETETPVQVLFRDTFGRPIIVVAKSGAYNIQSGGRVSGSFPNPPAIQQSSLQEDLP
ncbi:MAG: hypothetical protein ACREBU_23185, partial [Nitrososphaera sp.]